MSPSGRQGSVEQPHHAAAEEMPQNSIERKEALLFTGFFRQKQPREQKAILLLPLGPRLQISGCPSTCSCITRKIPF